MARPRKDFVVQRNGEVRQAGASQADGAWVQAFRTRAERSLYVFAKGVLDYWFLTPNLHKPVADWLQTCPPYRKLLLMPRDHAKTTLAPRSLPLHMWIQPREHNVYFPDMPGTHTRILSCGETEGMAKGNLRVIRSHLEQNDLLRALWPHIAWDNPRRDAKVWNDTDINVPRDTEFAEASLECIGVGGTKTGKHPNCLLKDDITTEKAANSDVEMQTAIEWHVNTRALLSNQATNLEFITATYWAVYDLPHYVEENDPSVAVNTKFRGIVDEANEIIWPEKPITRETINQLMKEFGPRFYLLYMNSVSDSALVDFARDDIRLFNFEDGELRYTDDERDTGAWSAKDFAAALADDAPRLPHDEPDFRGRRLHDPDVQESLRARAYRARAT